jgi:anti-sigma factor RsiW
MIDDMPCQTLVELVTDYLEGKLHPDDRRRFEAHLAACRHCHAYLDQMRHTVKALGRLSLDRLAPEAQRDLLQAFRDFKRA